MLTVLSPAKSLDYDTPAQIDTHSLPDFIEDSKELISHLRQFNPKQIANLMGISDPLADLNFARYQNWSPKFSSKNSKQALLAFNGDVYEGLAAHTLNHQALDFAQHSIRILSGLYGLLRPLDWMQPYRLEMGTRLATARGKDLYAFWNDRLSIALNHILATEDEPTLINLASNEYFKAIKCSQLKAQVITPVFEDWNKSTHNYRIIAFYAKRARGLMARYIIDHRITDAHQLQSFNLEGYTFIKEASNEGTWIFRRKLTS